VWCHYGSVFFCTQLSSVADPDPCFCAFFPLDPDAEKVFSESLTSDPGSPIQPIFFSESLVQFGGLKLIKLFFLLAEIFFCTYNFVNLMDKKMQDNNFISPSYFFSLLDPGSRIQDPGWKNPGKTSRIRNTAFIQQSFVRYRLKVV